MEEETMTTKEAELVDDLQPAGPELIEAARERYETDDIEIDDNAKAARGDDPGTWVQAWVWVPDVEGDDATG